MVSRPNQALVFSRVMDYMANPTLAAGGTLNKQLDNQKLVDSLVGALRITPQQVRDPGLRCCAKLCILAAV